MTVATAYTIDDTMIGLLSASQAWHYRVVPCDEVDGTLRLLVDDQQEAKTVKIELEVLLGKRIQLLSVSSQEAIQLLNEHYKRTYENSGTKDFDIRGSDDFLDLLIKEARQLGSSDIHIEKYEEKARVRYRIDGVLIERYSLELSQYPVVVNKLKIKANLDIAEKRLPQDGRIAFKRFSEEFDIRMSVIPTLHGEKIVLRLLNRDATDIDIRKLGMSDHQYKDYLEGLKKPNGIVLISGPTGSGKTTTLYASLKMLNDSERNIMTIEDPVEYTLEGVNQVQLRENIGLGFSAALRSFLRQDPDIIMLGEIRDKETAEMAIRASLTGHLVLSTIHTNSAWGTISRLIDMGIPSYMLANTMNTSVAQRLVRKLCSCKVASALTQADLPRGYNMTSKEISIYAPVGCDDCFNTGYRGRIAVYEIIGIDAHFEEAIRSNTVLQSEAIKENGVALLSDQAFNLLAAGETSLYEVYPLLMNR